MLLCLSLTACSNDIILTEDPSLTNPINISGSAETSGTASVEETQLTSGKENSVSQTQTPDSTQSSEPTAVTVSTVENPPEEGQVTTASTTVTTTTAAKPVTAAATTRPAPVVTTATTTAAPPVVTAATTAAPPAVTTTTTKAIEGFVDRYNQRQQEQWEKDFAEQVFKLTNEFRVKNQMPPFKKMDALNNAAVTRAWEILYDYRSDHARPDGQKYFTVFNENGIQYHKCGENIAAGQTTPEEVMKAWINSPGHKANILSDDFTYLGVGMYYKEDDTYGYYWSQEFCCLFE